MSRIFINTATSDRWKYGRDIPDTTQPHMIRLSWILEEDDGSTIRDASHLIKLPPGAQVSGETQHVTGIYQHFIEARGMRMFEVLSEFGEALGEAQLVVAFSWSGHKQVLERSFRYVGMPERVWPPSIDAMIKATDIVQVPAMQPGRKFKWPSFDEACDRILGACYRPTDDPVADGMTRVRNVRTIYENIVRAGLA